MKGVQLIIISIGLKDGKLLQNKQKSKFNCEGVLIKSKNDIISDFKFNFKFLKPWNKRFTK